MSNEEELQKRIEMNESLNTDDIHAKAYQRVFRALKREPSVSLSSTFADKVLDKISGKESKILSTEHLWLGVGLLLSLITFVITIVATDFKFSWGFLAEISEYKGIFIFSILFISMLHFLDKKLVRQKHHSL